MTKKYASVPRIFTGGNEEQKNVGMLPMEKQPANKHCWRLVQPFCWQGRPQRPVLSVNKTSARISWPEKHGMTLILSIILTKVELPHSYSVAWEVNYTAICTERVAQYELQLYYKTVLLTQKEARILMADGISRCSQLHHKYTTHNKQAKLRAVIRPSF